MRPLQSLWQAPRVSIGSWNCWEPVWLDIRFQWARSCELLRVCCTKLDALRCSKHCYRQILGGGLEHFYFFPYIGDSHPNWLIFFRGVDTTNQNWAVPKITLSFWVRALSEGVWRMQTLTCVRPREDFAYGFPQIAAHKKNSTRVSMA